MCSIIIIDASKLTKFGIVNVFYGSGPIELLNPQTHAHIFHFKELQREEYSQIYLFIIVWNFVDRQFTTVDVITY